MAKKINRHSYCMRCQSRGHHISRCKRVVNRIKVGEIIIDGKFRQKSEIANKESASSPTEGSAETKRKSTKSCKKDSSNPTIPKPFGEQKKMITLCPIPLYITESHIYDH